jgi:hypothetical protein
MPDAGSARALLNCAMTHPVGESVRALGRSTASMVTESLAAKPYTYARAESGEA